MWNAQLNLNWTLFDGGKRRSDLAHAVAEKKNAQAELSGDVDRAEDQIWTAYTNMKTAFAQQHAAHLLLEASDSSYTAALESYKYGVRSIIDVVAAQRALAQARSEDVTARANVFRQTATLAFRTGDLLRKPVPVPATLPPGSTAPPLVTPVPAPGRSPGSTPGNNPGTPPIDGTGGGVPPAGAGLHFIDTQLDSSLEGNGAPGITGRNGWER